MPMARKMSVPTIFLPLFLAILAAFSPLSSGCCDCCCCGGSDDSALLMALLGGGAGGLSLGRKKRATLARGFAAAPKNASLEEKPMDKKFRFGTDDPTPHLMGWPVHSPAQLKPFPGTLEAQWYKKAFADEKERQRQRAKARPRANVVVGGGGRHKRLAEVLEEAVEKAVELRGIRQKQKEKEEKHEEKLEGKQKQEEKHEEKPEKKHNR